MGLGPLQSEKTASATAMKRAFRISRDTSVAYLLPALTAVFLQVRFVRD